MEDLRSMGVVEACRSQRWERSHEAAPLGSRIVALARLAAAVHMVQAARALAQRASITTQTQEPHRR